MTVKLTQKYIQAAAYEGKDNERDVRWDNALAGFGIRIYPSGKKAFILSYRHEGRKQLMTIGAYGPLTLDQARDRACKHLADIIDKKNPLAEKRKNASAKTIGELCEVYMKRHGSKKKTASTDQCRIDQKILPRWKNIRIQALTKREVADAHHAIGEHTPYEANRLLALLRKMFNCAREWELVDASFINPAQGITMHKEKSRDRWVQADELPALATAIDTEKSIYVRNLLWLYLMTGARKSELLTSRWEHIDWQRNELKLPDTKANRVHYLPLNTAAITLLKNLPREKGNPYIFPGAKEGQHLVNISKAWLRVRKLAGVDDVRLHDLRRTVGSWLAQSGNDLHLIGKILNHSNLATTAVYARFNQNIMHEALESHGLRLMEASKEKVKDKEAEIA